MQCDRWLEFGAGCGERTEVSGNRTTASGVPFGSLGIPPVHMCAGGNFKFICLPGFCGLGMLGRESWMPGVALAPRFLSSSALCPQIPNSTEAPGPRDAPRPPLAIAGARAPDPDTANPRQFPCPVHLWLVGREAQPTSGQPRKKVQPISGQTDRAQPTLGGRRGPRSPAGARSAPPCCGGRCRGRCGSFSVGPAAPGSNRHSA